MKLSSDKRLSILNDQTKLIVPTFQHHVYEILKDFNNRLKKLEDKIYS